jgi:hypothetical protein
VSCGGCLPSARGLRKGWGASPPHQGEWWGDRTDEGVHRGGLWELRVAVVDIAPQLALAGLEGAGNLVIAAVAIDDHAAWQPGLAEDVLRPAGRPGLPDQKQAEPGGVAVRAELARCWRNVDDPFGVTGVTGVAAFPGSVAEGGPSRPSPSWRAAPGSGARACSAGWTPRRAPLRRAPVGREGCRRSQGAQAKLGARQPSGTRRAHDGAAHGGKRF